MEQAREIASHEHAQLNSAQALARRCGLSPGRLRQLFHQAGGESPSEMLWRLKVEHAIQLIRFTGLTLQEIGDQCGYANPFHLSRAVKQYSGQPPRVMRRRAWADSKI